MKSDFVLYGSTGYVGNAIARRAVEQGLHPLLAGRNRDKLAAQAAELPLPYSVLELGDSVAWDAALADVPVVLNCAGPFIHTFRPVVEACLRSGRHYLDITGEIPVYEQIAACDAQARQRGVMLMPGAGFDVVPTDCLAVHLKNRLPSATHLTLAWDVEHAAGLPPGTFRTIIEMAPYGTKVRRAGEMVPAPQAAVRMIDFGRGPAPAGRLLWGDVFTAYYSTSIPNIEEYFGSPKSLLSLSRMLTRMAPLLRIGFVREFLKRMAPPGSPPEVLARARVNVWGEAQDDQGRRVISRLHGPEPGVLWTCSAALAIMRKVLAGNAPVGYQTPAMAYGADLVLECEGVTREDVE